ncbi:MAG TPA: glycosyltransferase family protein [Kofleriaceae bacterium]
MRTVAIVQARMGSSRLPGKVLADVAGQTMLARVLGRLAAADLVTETVVATTNSAHDAAIVAEAARLGVAAICGSETDVLARYLAAARAANADVIVRVTADCPLLDPHVVDLVIEACTTEVDYASNTHTRSYPRGLDVEALHRDTLERIARLGTSPSAREHVTAFVMAEPALFRIRQVRASSDDSDLRWTVDTDEDLAMVRDVYGLVGDDLVPYREVVALVRARPALAARNAGVAQKAWR